MELKKLNLTQTLVDELSKKLASRTADFMVKKALWIEKSNINDTMIMDQVSIVISAYISSLSANLRFIAIDTSHAGKKQIENFISELYEFIKNNQSMKVTIY